MVEKENETAGEAMKEEDLEKGEERKSDVSSNDHQESESHLSSFHRLNPTNPLRIVLNSSTRVATPPPPRSQPSHSHTRSTPTPQQQVLFFFLSFMEIYIFLLKIMHEVCVCVLIVFFSGFLNIKICFMHSTLNLSR